MSRGAELVRIERELKRCAEDATRARNRLMAVTSCEGADGLARLNGSSAWLEVLSALNELQQCAARAAELLKDKRDVARA